ncbi:hypothetical protein [Helicobacter pylori]|nr:hypothetical protein [Helicobacter pylori]
MGFLISKRSKTAKLGIKKKFLSAFLRDDRLLFAGFFIVDRKRCLEHF